ncbi:MAG: GMC family oxidoreductase [Deltaproteobacteria bacterium]|nr:GMC family oxidoreductase [Deltaproteobacteria bacterium]
MILGPGDAQWSALAEQTTEVDVVIIGSGAGGAAASMQFADAGLSVLVLEEGGHFDERAFSQDQGVAWRQLYADDGQRVMSGNLYVPVAGGRCLGGSTVVNSAICFTIPQWRFEEWRAEHDLAFDWDELQPWLRRTERFIKVTASRPSIYGGNNAACQRGLDALGWSGGPMMRNAPACMGCGACQMGCPSGAKLSVAKTYIPRATQAGARFVTRARADEVVRDDGRVVGVRAALLDPETREPLHSITVRARAVVVAAGAIRTPVFLQANDLGNDHVGEHLHVHPGSGVIGVMNEEVQGWRGIPQGFYCDEWHRSEGVMLESFWATPEVFYMSFPFGNDGMTGMNDFSKMTALGGLISDASEGSVRPSGTPGRAKVNYQVVDADRRKLVLAQLRSAQILFAAGARSVRAGVYGVPELTSPTEAAQYLDPNTVRLKQLMAVYSSHPHGTTRMGDDPTHSAVDSGGKLHGEEGVYVMDGSLFPDVLGVNPQVTIMAMASMLAQRLATTLA